MSTRADILDEAKRIVTQDRNDTYGEPEELFAAINAIWDGIDAARGTRARSAVDVGLYLAGLKLARAAAAPLHVDSYIDGAGYFACAGDVVSQAPADARSDSAGRVGDAHPPEGIRRSDPWEEA